MERGGKAGRRYSYSMEAEAKENAEKGRVRLSGQIAI